MHDWEQVNPKKAAAVRNGFKSARFQKTRVRGAFNRGDETVGQGVENANLSLATLQNVAPWFMRVMLDQIWFTGRLFDDEGLKTRCRRLERSDAALVLKVSPVTARKTLNDLVRLGFLVSDSPKTSVRLAFSLDYRERLLSNLFTDAPPE